MHLLEGNAEIGRLQSLMASEDLVCLGDIRHDMYTGTAVEIFKCTSILKLGEANAGMLPLWQGCSRLFSASLNLLQTPKDVRHTRELHIDFLGHSGVCSGCLTSGMSSAVGHQKFVCGRQSCRCALASIYLKAYPREVLFNDRYSLIQQHSNAVESKICLWLQSGFGCLGHPTTNTHAAIADFLQDFIGNLTGWTPVAAQGSSTFIFNN